MEEEAQNILDSYTRVKFRWLPLKRFGEPPVSMDYSDPYKRLEKSTSCYPIMGQNMGQEVLCRNTKIISKLFEQKAKEKVLKSVDFRTIYGCGGRTRTYDLRVMRS